MQFNLSATCKLGLEGLVRDELADMSLQNIRAENGAVRFEADAAGLAKANLWLRMSERVLYEVARFPAMSFDDLYEGAARVGWAELLPKDAAIRVLGNCIQSQLMSERTCQSILKKAIVDALGKKHKVTELPETGPEFLIRFEIKKDEAGIFLDSSGAGLHKRGYRQEAGLAPLRETLAAALVKISRWKPPRPLIDPFCGSGTIAIEAALMAQNHAPGLNRAFAAEHWPFIAKEAWESARKEARAAIKNTEADIQGYDKDPQIVELARENALKAGVEKAIRFEVREFSDFRAAEEYGTVITNPPYCERLEDIKEAEALIRAMGQKMPAKKGWAYHVLSAHERFESLFGRPADSRHKLYNGKIKCALYGYFKNR